MGYEWEGESVGRRKKTVAVAVAVVLLINELRNEGIKLVRNKLRFTIHVLLVSILLIINTLSAQTAYTKYGWQLYENAGDARSLALGNTMIADKSAIATLWNPAIGNISDLRNFTYAHQSRFSGIVQSDLAAFPLNINKNRKINIVVLHESVGKIPNTTDLLLDWGLDGIPNTGDQGENNGYLDEGERLSMNEIAYFNQRQFGVHLSTQFTYRGIDFGIAVRTLFHSLGDNFGSGLGLNIGASKRLWKGALGGLTIQNAVPAMIVWDSGTIEKTKPMIGAGLAQKFGIEKIPIDIMILGDLLLNISDRSLSDDFHLGSASGNARLGLELNYKDKILLRGGRNQVGFYSVGIGLLWTNFELNYAFRMSSSSVELGSSHFISFGLNTDWVIELMVN